MHIYIFITKHVISDESVHSRIPIEFPWNLKYPLYFAYFDSMHAIILTVYSLFVRMLFGIKKIYRNPTKIRIIALLPPAKASLQLSFQNQTNYQKRILPALKTQ